MFYLYFCGVQVFITMTIGKAFNIAVETRLDWNTHHHLSEFLGSNLSSAADFCFLIIQPSKVIAQQLSP